METINFTIMVAAITIVVFLMLVILVVGKALMQLYLMNKAWKKTFTVTDDQGKITVVRTDDYINWLMLDRRTLSTKYHTIASSLDSVRDDKLKLSKDVKQAIKVIQSVNDKIRINNHQFEVEKLGKLINLIVLNIRQNNRIAVVDHLDNLITTVTDQCEFKYIKMLNTDFHNTLCGATALQSAFGNCSIDHVAGPYKVMPDNTRVNYSVVDKAESILLDKHAELKKVELRLKELKDQQEEGSWNVY
jgi:hypothetical protein